MATSVMIYLRLIQLQKTTNVPRNRNRKIRICPPTVPPQGAGAAAVASGAARPSVHCGRRGEGRKCDLLLAAAAATLVGSPSRLAMDRCMATMGRETRSTLSDGAQRRNGRQRLEWRARTEGAATKQFQLAAPWKASSLLFDAICQSYRWLRLLTYAEKAVRGGEGF